MNFKRNILFLSFFTFLTQFSLFSCSVNINNNSTDQVLVIDVNHYITALINPKTELKRFGDPDMRAHFYVSVQKGDIYTPVKEVVQTACTGSHMININLDEILATSPTETVQLQTIPIRVSNFSNDKKFPERMHKFQGKEESVKMDLYNNEENILLTDSSHTQIPFKENFVRQYNEPGKRFYADTFTQHNPNSEVMEDSQQVEESSVDAWLPQSDLQ